MTALEQAHTNLILSIKYAKTLQKMAFEPGNVPAAVCKPRS